jgi:hypothetical protein
LKWEYCKTALRSIAPNIYNRKIKEEARRRDEIIEALTRSKNNLPATSPADIEKVETEINNLTSELDVILEKEADTLSLKAGIKWRELGERSTKYFMGLIKKRYEDLKIGSLVDHNNETKFLITDKLNIVEKFYANLYKKDDTVQGDKATIKSFIQGNKGSLSPRDVELLEAPLTIAELKSTLGTCKDSAPGSDGIPYLYYKKYSNILLPYLLEAWNYSLVNNSLTISQKMAVITLLPKKGKDPTLIANWRPISLSNCDLKLITKAYALRLNHVLPKIVDPSQAAYIKGKRITDNIRLLASIKNTLKNDNNKAAIIALDVKKAYDSLSHEYLINVLEEYGFATNFIKIITLLYKENSAKILVNGFLTEDINLQRGVKQGDALSCGLFIIAMDPLIRKLNRCKEIEYNRNTNNFLSLVPNCLAYADDLTVITRPTARAIQVIFNIYSAFTKMSGLELNADKTEILVTGENKPITFKVNYLNSSYELLTVTGITVGGIRIDNDSKLEYKTNILDKIECMGNQLNRWRCRDLSIHGRSLVAKAFGFSQIIYSLQTCKIEIEDLKRIERMYFSFLWKGKPERIKRSKLKNTADQGGINAMDVFILNESLKLKQVSNCLTRHDFMSEIQHTLLKEDNPSYSRSLNFHFNGKNKNDPVTAAAQATIVSILDNYESTKYSSEDNEIKTSLINMALNTNLEAYCNFKKLMIAHQQFRRLNHTAPTPYVLRDMFVSITEEKFDTRDWNLIMHAFNCLPRLYKDIIQQFGTDENDNNFYIHHVNKAVCIDKIATNDLQKFLKGIRKCIEIIDLQGKHDIDIRSKDASLLIRRNLKNIKNPKLKYLLFRCWHGDIYSKSRMKKFNMTETNTCDRCGMVESQRHQIYECNEAQLFWKAYNKLMVAIDQPQSRVITYKNVLLGTAEDIDIATVMRVLFIKMNIQIVRPKFSEVAMWNSIKKFVLIEAACAKSKSKKDLWAELLRQDKNQLSGTEQVDSTDHIS